MRHTHLLKTKTVGRNYYCRLIRKFKQSTGQYEKQEIINQRSIACMPIVRVELPKPLIVEERFIRGIMMRK